MSTLPRSVLVIGATGQLGGAVARRLLDTGHRVRALGRNPEKLAALKALGAEIAAGDLLDAPFVLDACSDVDQVLSTANNALGSGASSPNKVDLRAYSNICHAVREHRVSRIVHVSAQDTGGASSPVDFFRIKFHVDALVRECGVPWVLLAPTVFMEIWVETLLGGPILQGKPVMLFGDGTARANFIATDDVAEFALRILDEPSIRNTVIEVGGPTTCSFADVTTMIERRLGVTAKRRHMPSAVLRAGSIILRPFSEMTARLMAMGYFTARATNAFTDWEPAANRFGVVPMTLQQFVDKTFVSPA
ncbi:SDR family oxidoreductase [Gemmatimonas sp.]|uniref:SDR family oxidoreductase n=1 Tax=Gemmatimonas sp. TaxID=1962908 RepID=UPI00286A29F3|nr:SDR family oxidoreductase [Gemmatimonas sp.]